MSNGHNDPMAPSTDTPSISASELRTRKIFSAVVASVRLRLRDFANGQNRLVAGEEFSDRQIGHAILLTIEEFNTTPPLLKNFGITNFPSIDLLIRGTIAKLMLDSSFLQLRNQLTYSDGQGLRNSGTEKPDSYIRWHQLMKAQWKQDTKELKMAINLRDALTGESVVSEYLIIHGLIEE